MAEEQKPEEAVREFIEWQRLRDRGYYLSHRRPLPRFLHARITSPRWGAFLLICGVAILLVVGGVVLGREVGEGDMSFWVALLILAAFGCLLIVGGIWWLVRLKAGRPRP